jgi:hypothetical protein
MSMDFSNILQLDVLGEIFTKCMVVDGIHLSSVNIFYHTFAIKYDEYSDILIYIMSKNNTQMYSFNSVKQIFGRPQEVIDKFQSNPKIQKRICRLVLHQSDMIDVKYLYKLMKHNDVLIQEQDKIVDMIKCMLRLNKIDTLIALLHRLKAKCPNKVYDKVNLVIEQHCIEHEDIMLASYMNFKHILDMFTKRVYFEYEAIRGAVKGEHISLFESLWHAKTKSLNKYQMSILLIITCMNGNLNILTTLLGQECCAYNHVIIAILYGRCNILDHIYDKYKDKDILVSWLMPIPNLSMSSVIEKYITKGIVFMSVKKLCFNRDRKSVDILISHGYKDNVKLENCLCGHRWKL